MNVPTDYDDAVERKQTNPVLLKQDHERAETGGKTPQARNNSKTSPSLVRRSVLGSKQTGTSRKKNQGKFGRDITQGQNIPRKKRARRVTWAL